VSSPTGQFVFTTPAASLCLTSDDLLSDLFMKFPEYELYFQDLFCSLKTFKNTEMSAMCFLFGLNSSQYDGMLNSMLMLPTICHNGTTYVLHQLEALMDYSCNTDMPDG
jgi:hypothetical protein